LLAEKQTYERIHATTKHVLAEFGIETRNGAIVALLEATGLAGYDVVRFLSQPVKVHKGEPLECEIQGDP